MALIHFNDKTFQEAAQKPGVMLVDFWATWCGPCRMIAPAIEQIAAEYEGKAVIGKVDVDQEGALAQQFGIMSIPCVVILKDGKEVARKVGAMPKFAYTDALDAAL
ncbi:MAG: thioredoxin [Oscillospiraceae bacterium]|nr:thioredoxin [Oscillospiraceae bacterium]